MGKRPRKKSEKAVHEFKEGELESGRSGKPVKSKKQAVAIGLSRAREKGAKVPAKKSAPKKTSNKKAAAKKPAKKSSKK